MSDKKKNNRNKGKKERICNPASATTTDNILNKVFIRFLFF